MRCSRVCSCACRGAWTGRGGLRMRSRCASSAPFGSEAAARGDGLRTVLSMNCRPARARRGRRRRGPRVPESWRCRRGCHRRAPRTWASTVRTRPSITGILGPGDSVAARPARDRRVRQTLRGHGLLPRQLQLPEPLVGPGGAGATDWRPFAGREYARIPVPYPAAKSGPVGNRMLQLQPVVLSHAARLAGRDHERFLDGVWRRYPMRIRSPGTSGVLAGPGDEAFGFRQVREPSGLAADGLRHRRPAGSFAARGRVRPVVLARR